MESPASGRVPETGILHRPDSRDDLRQRTVDDARCPTCGRAHRSKREHNTLFGVISMAFDNWPETSALKPLDAEHLRALLLIECGHTDGLDVNDLCEGNPAVIAAVGKFFCDGRRDFRLVNCGNRLHVLRPRTLQKDVIGVETYRKVAQAVYEIIAIETGLTVEDYKEQKRQENAKGRTPA